MSTSAIYEGWVRHRRYEPVEHEFRYRLFLMYLDLERLPELLDPYPLYSARRPAPARFERSDYMGDPARPLAECARDAVERSTGTRPAGPVRMLTNLRFLGHVFNPVSLYYCFEEGGERVEAVVADVNNIPWGERHPYVLGRGGAGGPVLRDAFAKQIHVSPLMGMDHHYRFSASEPGEGLQVHIESHPTTDPKHARTRSGGRASKVSPRTRSGGGAAPVFDATLSLRRRELNRGNLLRMLARYPAISLQVVGRIYAQTLRLKLKGARYFPHPEGSRPQGFLSL